LVQKRAVATQRKLIGAATELIRRKGYVATTIDDICEQSGVTKGAFFHHYKTKEELAVAALEAWDEMVEAMEESAPFQKVKAPRKRVVAYMEFLIGVFTAPGTLKSCLAGTTAQEVSDTNPALRNGANACFVNAQARFQEILDAACKGSRKRVNTASLSALWMATIQGSLILYKASQDAAVIRGNLEHVKRYITDCLPQSS